MTDTRFKAGESGNPAGRPRRKSVADLVGADLVEIVEAVKKAAKGGDIQAAKLLMPPFKPELPRVHVQALVEARTATERGEAILRAAGAGEISPTTAESLTTSLSNVTRVAEMDELVKRMEAIEAALKERFP